MTISLYDITASSYLQTLRALQRVLDKGKVHFEESGIDLDEVVSTRLVPDMLPFRFQVISTAHHSAGAMKAIESGEFRPPMGYPEFDYNGLQGLISDSINTLEKLTPEEVNTWSDNELKFLLGDKVLPFTAKDFVLSFSHPNFYFHATTTYDILRMKNVPLGKKDYLGRLRMITA